MRKWKWKTQGIARPAWSEMPLYAKALTQNILDRRVTHASSFTSRARLSKVYKTSNWSQRRESIYDLL
jgi:hypothetical protein